MATKVGIFIWFELRITSTPIYWFTSNYSGSVILAHVLCMFYLVAQTTLCMRVFFSSFLKNKLQTVIGNIEYMPFIINSKIYLIFEARSRYVSFRSVDSMDLSEIVFHTKTSLIKKNLLRLCRKFILILTQIQQNSVCRHACFQV